MHNGIQLYPDGVHPAAVGMNPTYTGYAQTLRCADVPSIKYYFTDFGLSTRFEDPNQPHLVVGGIAANGDVPELSNVIPYDPFRVDIFTLGNVFKTEFLKVSISSEPPSTSLTDLTSVTRIWDSSVP